MIDVRLILGDCLDVLKTLPSGSVDAVITDPPYGVGKAAWDAEFPTAWYDEARRVAKTVAVITGSSGLKDTIPLVGEDFLDVMSFRNMNGMTRGPLGFGNWLAVVVAGEKPKQGQNAFRFYVKGNMPDHPSPKPIEFMQLVVQRLSSEFATILDPFMGSGTTGVACLQTGRNFIGVEIDPAYFAIAEKRIKAEQERFPLFDKAPEQQDLFAEAE